MFSHDLMLPFHFFFMSLLIWVFAFMVVRSPVFSSGGFSTRWPRSLRWDFRDAKTVDVNCSIQAFFLPTTCSSKQRPADVSLLILQCGGFGQLVFYLFCFVIAFIMLTWNWGHCICPQLLFKNHTWDETLNIIKTVL